MTGEVGGNGEQRPFLPAVVGPLAAVYMDRQLGPELRRMARDLAALGQVDASRQMSSAAAQLRESARQLVERTSSAGSGEVPEASGSAGSGDPPRSAVWWSTSVAGEELGVTRRQAWNLAQEGGPLTSVTEGGRMFIDPVSVIAEKQRRQGDDG